MSTFTTAQQQNIKLVGKILDVIAMFLVSTTLIVMVVFRQWRTARYQFVFFLFICFWLNLIMNLLMDYDYSPNLCWVYGPWVLFFTGAVWLWDVAIAVSLYRLTVYMRLRKPSFFTHWMIWSLQILLTALPATTDDYGPPSCFINRTSTGWIWQFVVRYGPLIVYLLLVLALYCIVAYRTLTRGPRGQAQFDSKTRKSVMFLFLYPIALWVSWLPTLVYKLYNWASNNRVYQVEIGCAVMFCLHPIFSALIYLWPTVVALFQRCNTAEQKRDATAEIEMRAKTSDDCAVDPEAV